MHQLLKSVLDCDRSPIVICNTEHRIVYMNQSAIDRYRGSSLVGRSIFDCHNEKSRELIIRVVEWFGESYENNVIYTYRNDEENKDVYMVALRDNNSNLIGYYEKHEYRNTETAQLYDFSHSL